MELKRCANAMVNAVEKYMKENDPKKNAVSDIRFILFDQTAFEVFKVEVEKRYGDSKVKSTGKRKDSQPRGDGTRHDDSGSAGRDDNVGEKTVGKSVVVGEQLLKTIGFSQFVISCLKLFEM